MFRRSILLFALLKFVCCYSEENKNIFYSEEEHEKSTESSEEKYPTSVVDSVEPYNVSESNGSVTDQVTNEPSNINFNSATPLLVPGFTEIDKRNDQNVSELQKEESTTENVANGATGYFSEGETDSFITQSSKEFNNTASHEPTSKKTVIVNNNYTKESNASKKIEDISTLDDDKNELHDINKRSVDFRASDEETHKSANYDENDDISELIKSLGYILTEEVLINSNMSSLLSAESTEKLENRNEANNTSQMSESVESQEYLEQYATTENDAAAEVGQSPASDSPLPICKRAALDFAENENIQELKTSNSTKEDESCYDMAGRDYYNQSLEDAI